eukprot:2318419-Pyramimonas_sp.AAC.1
MFVVKLVGRACGTTLCRGLLATWTSPLTNPCYRFQVSEWQGPENDRESGVDPRFTASTSRPT